MVKGLVKANGAPLVCARVQVYDKDLRTEQLLGEAITNTDGYYEVPYTADQFRRAEKRTGDLTFRVFSQEGIAVEVSDVIVGEASLPEPKVLFNAPAEVWANLVVSPPARLSEYEKLLLILQPVLEDVQLADLSADDVIFLVGETGIERNFLEWLHGAAALSRETGVPVEAFYGWARSEPPLPPHWLKLLDTSEPERQAQTLRDVLGELIAAPRERLRASLLSAIDRSIIPTELGERLDEIIRLLKRQGVVMHQAVGRLLDNESGEPLTLRLFDREPLTVRLFDLDAGEPPEDLGIEAVDGQGRFGIMFPLPRTATADSERRLRLQVLDREAKPLFETEVRVRAEQQDVLDVRVPVPRPDEPTTHRLDELAATTRLTIPTDLLSFLRSRGIHTLGDVRRAGGIGTLEGIPHAADHAVVRALDSHADLNRILARRAVQRLTDREGIRERRRNCRRSKVRVRDSRARAGG